MQNNSLNLGTVLKRKKAVHYLDSLLHKHIFEYKCWFSCRFGYKWGLVLARFYSMSVLSSTCNRKHLQTVELYLALAIACDRWPHSRQLSPG